MKPPLSLLPALPAAIGLSAGIWLDICFDIGTVGLVVAAVAIVLTILLILFSRRFNDFFGFIVIFVAIGVFLSRACQPNPLPSYIEGETGTLTMRVSRVAEQENGLVCQAKATSWTGKKSATSIPCDFKLSLTIGGFDRDVKPGDVVEVKGRVKTVAEHSIVPDVVDYSRYAFIDGIVARMWAPTADVRVLRREPTFTERLRAEGSSLISDAIVSVGLSPSTESFLLATIVGDNIFLGDWLKDGFRATGLAHVLALSGLHVGIIVLIVTWLLYPMKVIRRLRTPYYLIVIALIMAYAIVVGMTPSVARAAVMATVFMVGRILQKRVAAYNYLCATVVIWLLINPYWLFSPGFQMSVLAAGAIMFAVNKINAMKLKRWRRRLALFIGVPIAAVLSTSAVSVFYFHTFPLWFLPANCLASLLVTPVIALGVGLVILYLAFGWAIPLFAWLEDVMYQCLEWIVRVFSSVGGGQLTDIYIEPYQVAVYMSALVFIVFTIRFRRRFLVGVTVILWMFFAATMFLAAPHVGDEMYILEETQSTDMIFRHNDTAYYVTTAVGPQRDKTLRTARTLYRDYLGRRGCADFVAPDSDFVLGPYRRVANSFILPEGKSLLLVRSDTVNLNVSHVTYLLIDKAFHADIISLVTQISPDTVILSHDIHATRRTRFQTELNALNIPMRPDS